MDQYNELWYGINTNLFEMPIGPKLSLVLPMPPGSYIATQEKLDCNFLDGDDSDERMKVLFMKPIIVPWI